MTEMEIILATTTFISIIGQILVKYLEYREKKRRRLWEEKRQEEYDRTHEGRMVDSTRKKTE